MRDFHLPPPGLRQDSERRRFFAAKRGEAEVFGTGEAAPTAGGAAARGGAARGGEGAAARAGENARLIEGATKLKTGEDARAAPPPRPARPAGLLLRARCAAVRLRLWAALLLLRATTPPDGWEGGLRAAVRVAAAALAAGAVLAVARAVAPGGGAPPQFISPLEPLSPLAPRVLPPGLAPRLPLLGR